MKHRLHALLAFVSFTAAAGIAAAQTTAPCPLGASSHCVYFTYEHDGMTIPAYTVAVRDDGRAMYWQTADVHGSAGKPPELALRKDTVDRLFAAASAVKAGKCETHEKNIANTGKKTLVLWSGDGYASCTFNYSDDPTVNEAATAAQALAATIQYGARLQREHRFDHLGLSAEMDSLVKALKDGSAIEVGVIEPVLQSLIEDDEVIGVVRRRAKELLDAAK